MVNLADVDNDTGTDLDGDGNDLDPVFTDFTDRPGNASEDPPIVYTVMTADSDIALVDLGAYPSIGAVDEGWYMLFRLGGMPLSWDGNGDAMEQDTNCSARAMRLGFTVGSDGDEETPRDTENHPNDTVGAAVGLCTDFAGLSSQMVAVVVDGADARIDAQDAVRDGFHWDMLSGAEMVEAAKAGGSSSSSGYEKNYGCLVRSAEGQG